MTTLQEFYDFFESNKAIVTVNMIEPYLDIMDYERWCYISQFQNLSEELMEKYSSNICWFRIFSYQKLSEEFIEKHLDVIEWQRASACQKLSESFIEKYADKVNWQYISEYQNLSEAFIEKHADVISWTSISAYQNLSEAFIEKHADVLCWDKISEFQKLSEEFIEKYSNDVYWYNISLYQKLSEAFIEKHAKEVHWETISKYQKLSESFIEKYSDKVHWYKIARFQKLSESFIEKYSDKLSSMNIKYNWLYKSKEEKLKWIKEFGDNMYEVIDNEYIIAYKAVRDNYYSLFNFQYKYEVGGIYESHCDCNADNPNSFGLSGWTKEHALAYNSDGKLLKIRINIDDIGTIVCDDNNKIRCFKFQVLEEVSKD